MIHNVIEDLEPLLFELSELNPDPQNARHDHNIAGIAKSLANYGQRKPIVVNKNGNIIEAGNGTWLAARSLGWTHLAAVFVTDSPDDHIGYAIADNRLGDASSWDVEILANSLGKIDEDVYTGFTPEDLQNLMDEVGFDDLEVPELPPDGLDVVVPESYNVIIQLETYDQQVKAIGILDKYGFSYTTL